MEVVKIIVDLYEMRAANLVPLSARQMEKVENVFRYNFFLSAIAILCDKYKISSSEIQEEISKRYIETELGKPFTPYKS